MRCRAKAHVRKLGVVCLLDAERPATLGAPGTHLLRALTVSPLSRLPSALPPAALQVKVRPPPECESNPMLPTCFPPFEPIFLPFFDEVSREGHATFLPGRIGKAQPAGIPAREDSKAQPAALGKGAWCRRSLPLPPAIQQACCCGLQQTAAVSHSDRVMLLHCPCTHNATGGSRLVALPPCRDRLVAPGACAAAVFCPCFARTRGSGV